MRLPSQGRASRLAVAAIAAAAFIAPASAHAGVFDSVAGWWPMYEGSGQVVHDLSGNGDNGTLGSTPGADANDPAWIRGLFFGSALRFDGNDFVRIPDSAKLSPQQLTVSLWVRGTGTPGTYRYIIGKGGDHCVSSSYAMTTTYNGGLVFYTWDGHQQHESTTLNASDVWDGKWHHVAGTWDGQYARLYLDGVNKGYHDTLPATVDYGLPTTTDAGLGGYLGTCDLYYTGDVDEVAVFNQPLAVDRIYATVKALFPRPLR
jgi:hypothetical protein